MTASQGFLHAVVSAAGSILGNRLASRVTAACPVEESLSDST